MLRGKRNVRSRLLIAAAVVLLALVGILTYRWVFVVRNVVIQGRISVADEEIIRAAHIDMGGPIRSVDAHAIKQHLESGGRLALDSVTVDYPNTVILSVRERTRDAMVLNGGRMLVMDSDGYVIEVCETMPDDAGVYITGLNGTSYHIGGKIAAPERQLQAMKIVLDELRDQNALYLASELNVSDDRNLWLISRTGIRVELGDTGEMTEKIRWMRSAVADLESRGENEGTLDISSGSKADYMP